MHVTLPYVRKLADLGFRETVQDNPPEDKGVNTYKGDLTCQGVAETFGLRC